jgi:hypothetical protein
MKKDLIDDIRLTLLISGEVLKSQGLISDYKVKTDIENLSVAPDGVLEYDVVITQTLLPKRSIQYVNLDFKVLPTKD